MQIDHYSWLPESKSYLSANQPKSQKKKRTPIPYKGRVDKNKKGVTLYWSSGVHPKTKLKTSPVCNVIDPIPEQNNDLYDPTEEMAGIEKKKWTDSEQGTVNIFYL